MDGYNCTSWLEYTVKKVTAIFPSPAGMCYFDHPNFFLFSRQTSRGTGSPEFYADFKSNGIKNKCSYI
jgi:hypothetical protein